jgi:3-deoxy-7-phosphoheptulonate synthase
MIIVLKGDTPDAQIDDLRELIEARGVRAQLIRGEHRLVLGCIGDVTVLRDLALHELPGVESVVPIGKPYRLAAREFAPGGKRSVIRVGEGVRQAIGGQELAIIAGPCSVESETQLRETARAVRRAGAGMLRGGAYKPRTSPYSFQGMGPAGLELLTAARRETGLPIVTEVPDPRYVETVAEHADVLQIGARNMQNYTLLAEVGRVRRPVLLKRGLAATITELLLAAEHVMTQGNHEVILCERGIRTFETATRFTLDVGAIAVLHRETHLPVIVDPSHAAGRADLVPALAFAAVAAGADGLIVEVHPKPLEARSDGDQALSVEAFTRLMADLRPFAAAAGRTLAGPPAEVAEPAA